MQTPLEQIIVQTIHRSGPISFCDFMEIALYHPEFGYYTSGGDKIGTRGDFLTSCSYTTVFGSLLARQLEEMDQKLGSPPFTIVEYGAGTGMLCRDILDRLKSNPALYERVRYCIIEKSEAMRGKEKELLGEKVCWYNNIKEIGPFSGCVISNELVDNFAVHQVVMKETLMEVFVGYENGFVEILKPARRALVDYLEELEVQLPIGFRTEINLEALHWTKDIATTLDKGFLLTIDYGCSSAGLYSQSRSEGTLVCYHRHKVNYSPYTNPGAQDITAHVNFSALNHWGMKNGLQLTGYTNQTYFLLGLGLSSQFTNTSNDEHSFSFVKQFLLDMGSKLKVLIQHKGSDVSDLAGLRFPLRLR